MGSVLAKKFTIMFIPHSEKRSVHIQVNGVLLVLVGLAMVLVFLSLLFFATRYAEGSKSLARESEIQNERQGNLNAVLGDVGELMRVYEVFDTSLAETLTDLNIPAGNSERPEGSGDLATISNLQELGTDSVTEVYEIRRLRDQITESIEPVGRIGTLLEREQALLAEIPTLWPVIGARNAMSLEYGPNIHPFGDRWYLNRGIDISGQAGMPIVASANGTVIEAKLDIQQGLGNTIIIEHKYGFQTRYSHLGRILVREGDQVSQGQQIGLMGKTGAATEPKLSFQIVLGTEILDPNEFLKIRNDLSLWLEQNRDQG